MAKGLGIVSVILGLVCLLSCVGYFFLLQQEQSHAQQSSQSLLQQVEQVLGTQPVPPPSEAEAQTAPEEVSADRDTPTAAPLLQEAAAEMPTVEVEGCDCIGILSVPVLELELPVLTPWSEGRLKKAPCHYYGSYYEENFVIAAHNYRAHFGKLVYLQAGDLILFTDVAGNRHCYEVVLLETLPPSATEDMVSGEFDLTLYTCTFGSDQRTTVRCKRLDPTAYAE